MAKLRRAQVMVAEEMIERGVAVRQVARQLEVTEGALRYRLGRLQPTDWPRFRGEAHRGHAVI
jgi:predicted transcriptional regulator